MHQSWRNDGGLASQLSRITGYPSAIHKLSFDFFVDKFHNVRLAKFCLRSSRKAEGFRAGETNGLVDRASNTAASHPGETESDSLGVSEAARSTNSKEAFGSKTIPKHPGEEAKKTTPSTSSKEGPGEQTSTEQEARIAKLVREVDVTKSHNLTKTELRELIVAVGGSKIGIAKKNAYLLRTDLRFLVPGIGQPTACESDSNEADDLTHFEKSALTAMEAIGEAAI